MKKQWYIKFCVDGVKTYETSEVFNSKKDAIEWLNSVEVIDLDVELCSIYDNCCHFEKMLKYNEFAEKWEENFKDYILLLISKIEVAEHFTDKTVYLERLNKLSDLGLDEIRFLCEKHKYIKASKWAREHVK